MDSNIDRISRGLAATTSRRQAFKMLGGGLLGGALAGAGFAVAKDTAAQPGPRGTATVLDAIGGTPTGDVIAQLTATFDQATQQIGISGLFNGEGFSELIGLENMQASCDVLYLDLLGLVVEITAVPGAGNLLGNLLCAVAGLLDQGGPLQGITGLLNNIFRNLG